MPVRPDKPIIQSLLDTDFYKFTMGQMVFHRHPDVPVEYSFVNRTKDVHLCKWLDKGQLREELDHVRTLMLSRSELHYLRGTNEYQDRMFREDYLEFLSKLFLPGYYLEWGKENPVIKFPGPWAKAIYWETIALSIINELYYRSLMKNSSQFDLDVVRATGISRLNKKIKAIKRARLANLKFSDFGTRRRFSRDWQQYVVRAIANELPKNFVGTSNTYLAMICGLLPMGTNAHENDMVYSGIYHGSDDEIRQSHQKMLQDWWDEYGWGLSIALTDTFGTDFFFLDMTRDQAAQWKGLRQDSGDPYEFGGKAIRFYQRYDIDPREKMAIFSDGLDVATMISLHRHFEARIKPSFGWGTNLTNDLGPKPLSLVVKVTRANGHGTVKLSDNIAKAIGAPGDIERFKHVFGYRATLNQECRY